MMGVSCGLAIEGNGAHEAMAEQSVRGGGVEHAMPCHAHQTPISLSHSLTLTSPFRVDCVRCARFACHVCLCILHSGIRPVHTDLDDFFFLDGHVWLESTFICGWGFWCLAFFPSCSF